MQEADAAQDDGFSDLLHSVFSDSNRAGCLLLDEVFRAFFSTNQTLGRHFSLRDVLESTSKRYLLFWHANVPYRATVRQRIDYEYEVVHLQLPNHGFVYQPITSTAAQTVNRHKSSTWRSLPASVALRNFPTISAMCSRNYDHARVFYNCETQRVDIQLRPTAANNLKRMFEISFEPGYVEETAMVPWQPWRGHVH